MLVRTLEVQEHLAPGEVAALLSLPSRLLTIPARSDLANAGTLDGHVAILCSGMLAHAELQPAGSQQITALYVPGDIVNSCAVVRAGIAGGYHALADSTLILVPATALRNLASKHFGVATALWREVAVEKHIAARWLVNIGRRDARTRLAHLLSELAVRQSPRGPQPGLEYPLPMTQQQIGDVVGLTSVHVNRTLKQLETIGTTARNRTVIIRDWEALIEAGAFDPGYLYATP